MKIRIKKTIKLIKRTQSSIKNRSSFFTMDRNERVNEFSQSNVRNCIKNIGSFDIRTYPNNYSVYKKIANWLNLKKENILITDGAEGALLRFMSAFANVKDKVIYLDPSFGMYKVYCDIFRLRKYPLKLDMKKNFNFFNQLVQHVKKVRPNIKITAVRSDIRKTKINNKLIDNQVANIQEAINSGIQGAIICTPASLHLKQSLEFAKNNINIFVEKPISNSLKNINKLLNIVKKNKLINKVGYMYKFDQSAKKFKNIIDRNILGKLTGVNIQCGSYLPNWRKNIDYTESNSAKKTYGGGALLELSHEIDYLQWIFKKIKKINYAIISKTSKLKVDTEESVMIAGKTDLVNFFIDLNFFSQYAQRSIIINGNNFTLKADLINNTIEIFKMKRKKIIKFKIDNNYSYKEQHKSILNNNYENSCSYKEGLKLMILLDKIKNFQK